MRFALEPSEGFTDTKLESVHCALNRVQGRSDVQMENGDVVRNVIFAAVIIDNVANFLSAPINDPVVTIKWFRGSTRHKGFK